MDSPRREAFLVLEHLQNTLDGKGQFTSVSKLVAIPKAWTDRTTAEQNELIAGVLRSEISRQGIAELRRYGRFGSLAEIFPEDAKAWAKKAGTRVEDCMAFRNDIAGRRAEVVLISDGTTFRIIRCNNVLPRSSS